MIIFGQGAIRCHPYARHEMEAALARDVARFDKRSSRTSASWPRTRRARCVLGLTGGALARACRSAARPEACSKKLSRYSAAFALVSGCLRWGTLGRLAQAQGVHHRPPRRRAGAGCTSPRPRVKKYVERGDSPRATATSSAGPDERGALAGADGARRRAREPAQSSDGARAASGRVPARPAPASAERPRSPAGRARAARRRRERSSR